MNKFIKLPLFLGSTCLVFCAALASVVYICEPVIAKNEEKKEKEAYLKLYEDVDEDDIFNLQDSSKSDKKELIQNSKISKIAAVEHGDISYVYTIKTKDPQSGPVTFMLGISSTSNKVDAYSMVSNNNAGYAKYYDNNSTVLEDILEDGKVTSAGATKTQNAVQEAIDACLSNYESNKESLQLLLNEEKEAK